MKQTRAGALQQGDKTVLTDHPLSRDGFLVLGMHRSGTSSVSGTLAKLGVTPPRNLMFGGADNPRGHWESDLITQMHEELLASANSRWDDWRPFDASWYATSIAAEFKQRAKALLASEFGRASRFVLKDPRICRFLPFWNSVFAEEQIVGRAIIPVRSPYEVAESLRARTNFSVPSLQRGLLIWLRHIVDAEYQSRSMLRAFVLWDQFLSDWRGEMDRMAECLEIQWPRLDDDAISNVDSFLDSGLKHEHKAMDLDRPGADGGDWLVAAYTALVDLCGDPFLGSACARLDNVRTAFNDASRIFGPLVADLETSQPSEDGPPPPRAPSG